ncbi:MAG: hypothetical protein ACE5JL_08645 [Dehalococcoidia bacterium]
MTAGRRSRAELAISKAQRNALRRLLPGHSGGVLLEAHTGTTKKDGTVVPGVRRQVQITRTTRAQTIYDTLTGTLERLPNGQETELK